MFMPWSHMSERSLWLWLSWSASQEQEMFSKQNKDESGSVWDDFYLQICPNPQLSGSRIVEHQANKNNNKLNRFSTEFGNISPWDFGEKCLAIIHLFITILLGNSWKLEKLLLVFGYLKITKDGTVFSLQWECKCFIGNNECYVFQTSQMANSR